MSMYDDDTRSAAQRADDAADFNDLTEQASHFVLSLTAIGPDGRRGTLDLHDVYVSRSHERLTDKAVIRLTPGEPDMDVIGEPPRHARSFEVGEIEVDLRIRGRLYQRADGEAYRITEEGP